jgi:hypothetical protein
MSQLKGQMKFTKDYLRHSGANSTPTMQAGGQSVQPYTQTPSQTLGSQLGTLGSSPKVPYPVGQEPPVGAYYTHPDGTIRLRVR